MVLRGVARSVEHSDQRLSIPIIVIVKVVVSQHVELRRMPYYEDKSPRPEYRFKSA